MRIVSLVTLNQQQRAMLLEAAPGAELLDGKHSDGPRLLGERGADVMLVQIVPPETFKLAPKLKWLQSSSAGVDHFLAGPLKDRPDVILTNGSGTHALALGEHVMALLLGWARCLPETLLLQGRHQWGQRTLVQKTRMLYGKTLGFVGYGSVARGVAHYAAAMGMRLLALKREPAVHVDPHWHPAGMSDPEGRLPERYFGPEQLHEMLALSDYVVASLPRTPQSDRMLDAAAFAAMKRGGFFVNVGRGEAIDQVALGEALRSGHLGGAGLDVTAPEPLPSDDRLWDAPNLILTPHFGGGQTDYPALLCQLFAENLRRYLSGRPLLNLVDRARGY